MKLKTLFVTCLFAAGALSSVALAKGPPGKDKGNRHDKSSAPSTSTTAAEQCRPSVAVVLKGEFVSGGTDGFVMHVTRANKHGRDFVGDDANLTVDDKTKFRRNGHAELADFEKGDRLNVQARMCKDTGSSEKASKNGKKSKDDDEDDEKSDTNLSPGGTGAAGEEAKLLARRVVGHPAKKSDSDD